mgnify:CR=1 FL=1
MVIESGSKNRLSPELKAAHCSFSHAWNFDDLDKSQDEQDRELRNAMRHMVTVQYTISGEEIGGIPKDKKLPNKLSLAWFQKAGLLQPIVLRFHGNVNEAIDFAWPEEIAQSVTHDPNTKDFWLELNADLEKRVPHVDLGRFFSSYDPDHNPGADGWRGRGKYYQVRQTFNENERNKYAGLALEDFVRGSFRPTDDAEFEELVLNTRDLIEIKLKKPYRYLKPTEEKISKPEFWEQLTKDLEDLEGKPTFEQFLMYFNPGVVDYKGLYSPNGKVQEHFARN